jgi:F0F1-type ATP synthase assembly protein I
MEQEKQNKENQPEKNSSGKLKETSNIYKYIGAGFQIVGPVLLGVIVGQLLDRYFHKENSLYTIILSSVMIVVALYLFIKQFLKN